MAALAAAEAAETVTAGDDKQALVALLIGLCGDFDVATGKVVSDKVFAEFYGVDAHAAAAGASACGLPRRHPSAGSGSRECSLSTPPLPPVMIFVEEYRVRRRDGTVSWVIARGKCWRDDAGRSPPLSRRGGGYLEIPPDPRGVVWRVRVACKMP